jgi:hypothetical protein
VSLAGTIAGIEPPVFRNSSSCRTCWDRSTSRGAARRAAWLGDVGADAKYNLTPSLTLDATYNTDFAQVEVDDQQVNLDRFNLFFPEKRPFFLENAGFFAVGNPGEVDLFFSRRIGIVGGRTGDSAVGGGRVSGKVGPVERRPAEHADRGGRRASDGDRGRAEQQLRRGAAQSRVAESFALGGVFVNRQGFGNFARAEDYNRTYAVDGKWASAAATFVSGFIAKTQTPGRDGRDHALNLRAAPTPAVDFDIGYQEVGDDFNPEVGFLTRRLPQARRARDDPLPAEDFLKLQEVRPHASYRGFWGFDGFQETGYTHLDNHWQFRNAVRDPYRHEPHARGRARAVRDLPRHLRAAGHLRQQRSADRLSSPIRARRPATT